MLEKYLKKSLLALFELIAIAPNVRQLHMVCQKVLIRAILERIEVNNDSTLPHMVAFLLIHLGSMQVRIRIR